MGAMYTWTGECPNCGGELECHEQLTSNMKGESCENCGYYKDYPIDDSGTVVTIGKGIVTRPGDPEKRKKTNLHNSDTWGRE